MCLIESSAAKRSCGKGLVLHGSSPIHLWVLLAAVLEVVMQRGAGFPSPQPTHLTSCLSNNSFGVLPPVLPQPCSIFC